MAAVTKLMFGVVYYDKTSVTVELLHSDKVVKLRNENEIYRTEDSGSLLTIWLIFSLGKRWKSFGRS